MEWLFVLRLVHILGAVVLLGTGAGIAFFMLQAHRTGEPSVIAHTARIVVLADTWFTAPAVVLQPVTGFALALVVGWPLDQGWLLAGAVLYVLTGACWLPVVWMQIRMRDLAVMALQAGEPLPAQYTRLFRAWVGCGIPAFAFVLAILALMVFKPAF